jgi:hypothetical protein
MRSWSSYSPRTAPCRGCLYMNRGVGPRLLRILEWGSALCANGLDSPHLTTLQWFRARLTTVLPKHDLLHR